MPCSRPVGGAFAGGVGARPADDFDCRIRVPVAHEDGGAAVAELRDLVMTQYLRRRDAAVQAGHRPGGGETDPSWDVLDDFAFQVVPTAIRAAPKQEPAAAVPVPDQPAGGVGGDIDEAKKVFSSSLRGRPRRRH